MGNEKQEFESRLYINNEFVHAKSGKTITVTNPANGNVVGTVEVAGPEDVDAAVAAASAAFKGEWSNFTGAQRKNCIMKFADLIQDRIPDLARADTLSMGIPIMMSQHFLAPWSVGTLRANAGYADKIEGQSFTDQDDGFYKVCKKFLSINTAGLTHLAPQFSFAGTQWSD
jgi:aldehyde dehydrogenase (NAD+)